MSPPPPEQNDSHFPATMWSAIISAREGGGSAAQKSLERLARAYWQPLYLFVRRNGHPHEEARDLTQGFFAHLLSRDFLKNLRPEAGRFRGFLVRSLQRWLCDQHDRRSAAKRGGGEVPVSLDALGDGHGAPATPEESAERAFDRQWAREIVARALAAVARTWSDRVELFQALRPSLDPQSVGSLAPYAEIAASLNSTEQAVKSAAFRLRQEYVASIRAEVRSTVADPSEVDDEIRHLVSLLRD